MGDITGGNLQPKKKKKLVPDTNIACDGETKK
jgi:hypothetical protein